jgi:hypothetical protein
MDERLIHPKLAELEFLRAFYNDMMQLYGQGYGVTNFHQNGDVEPLDTFLDSARGIDGDGN